MTDIEVRNLLAKLKLEKNIKEQNPGKKPLGTRKNKTENTLEIKNKIRGVIREIVEDSYWNGCFEIKEINKNTIKIYFLGKNKSPKEICTFNLKYTNPNLTTSEVIERINKGMGRKK